MADKLRSFFKTNIQSVEGGLELPTTEKGNISMNESFTGSECPFMQVVRPDKERKFCGRWASAICLVISLVLSYIAWHTDLYINAVSSSFVLRNGSRLFEVWENEPATTTLKIYLFNYTNKENYEAGLDEKLRVEEIGPYSYTVYTSRVNIMFNPNGTVTYQERKTSFFAPELSNGTLNDELVMPNLPYMGALDKMKDSYWLTRKLFSAALDKLGEPFVKVTAGDFIWGYQDNLMSMAYKASKFQETSLPHEKIGLLVGKNETQTTIYTIYTGENDISKKGIASRVDGEKALKQYSGTECNRLDGLSSMLMPPLQTTKSIYVYTKDACRRVPFHFKRAEFSRGIYTNRYELPENFLNFTGVNRCFCSETCLPDGVLNVSACAFGAPILASKPHFLHGDPILHRYVDGLKPTEELHSSYLNIQKDLGFFIAGRTSAQMNVMVRNLNGGTLSHVYEDKMILPVSWAEMTIDEFPATLLWEIHALITLFVISQVVIFYVPLVIATGSLIAMLWRQARRIKRERTQKSLKNFEVVHL